MADSLPVEPHRTAPRPFCFVLMPFAGEFDDIYEFGIRGACEDAGAYSERVDEQIYDGTVLDRVYNQISKADIVIADMTGKNPNVFYEVGYAHALGKPTILLTQESQDIPFDLKACPHLIYEGQIAKLKPELAKQVEYHVGRLASGEDTGPLDLRLFIDNVAVTEPEQIVPTDYTGDGRELVHRLVIVNRTANPFADGEVKIAATFPAGARCQHYIYREELVTPEGQQYVVIADAGSLLVDEPREIEFVMRVSDVGAEVPVVVRVYTPLGNRDFTVVFRGESEPST